MGRSIGVMTAERIAAGLVDGDKLTGLVRYFPEDPEITDALQGMPAESIAQCIRDQIETVARRDQIDAIGIGLPGVIQRGIIEDSPNLQQLKGVNIQAAITSALREKQICAPVTIFNDADVVAAGIAA